MKQQTPKQYLIFIQKKFVFKISCDFRAESDSESRDVHGSVSCQQLSLEQGLC